MFTPFEQRSLPSNACVLIVDDTPANLIAMEALVRTLKCEVATASSGEEAIALAGSREFALILLDVMMPGLNGFQTLQALRRLPDARATPVILITAQVLHRRDLEHAYELGAVDFISKPIEAPILLGKVRAFVAVFEQAQEIRRQAESLRAKDTHLGVLAHDLRTPLSVVSMTATILSSHPDPTVQRAAARLMRASGRMQTLSDDLLETARMALGTLRFHPEQVNLAPLLAEQLADFEATYPAVTFVGSLPASLDVRVDKLRVQQAVSNLLTNAVKYGDGHVSLRARRDELDATVIEVSNASAQPRPAHLEALFLPFERGSDAGVGVGLGLYIVREIAGLHSGSAVCDWQDGKVTFTLRLPRGVGEAPAPR